jgi:hypothetical protein
MKFPFDELNGSDLGRPFAGFVLLSLFDSLEVI